MVWAIIFFGLPLGFLASQLLIAKPDGFWVGHVNLYGDMVLHLGWITSFAWGENWPPINPVFAGGAASYPFLADLISGLLLRLGLPINLAIFLPTLFFLLLFIALFYQFTLRLTRDRRIAYLALFLFFFSGGLGFWYFLKDLNASHLPLGQFLTRLPRNYTDMKEIGFWWINSVTAFLFPQRNFLPALSLAIIVLDLIILKKRFLWGGILTGFLYFVHPHSTLALSFFFLTFWGLGFKKQKTWFISLLKFFLPMVVLNIIFSQLFFSQVTSIIQNWRFKIGWMAQREGVVVFWLKNAGLFLPLFLLALGYACKKEKTLAKIGVGALVLFLVPNFLILQPWPFDNSKILVYWLVLGCILISWLVVKFIFPKSKILTLILIFFLTFSGLLEVGRMFFPEVSQYRIFSQEDILAAEFIKKKTDSKSIFLTGTYHNQFVLLSGRRLVLGFPGWLWSYGINYRERERDVALIYQGKPETLPLLEKYQVNYLVIGQFEKEKFSVNEDFFKANFPLFYQSQNYKIYQID